MSNHIEYSGALIKLLKERGMDLSFRYEQNTETDGIAVHMIVTHDGKTVHDETNTGKSFSEVTQELSKRLFEKISETPKPRKIPEKTVVDVEDIKTTVIDEFFVANLAPIITDGKCPHCKNALKKRAYDIPVFNASDQFKRYYRRTLLTCDTCEKKFMPFDAWSSFLFDAVHETKTTDIKIPAVKNMRHRKKNEEDDRLFVPILNTKLYLKDNGNHQKEAWTGDFSTMNQESELKKRGYSTHMNEKERRQILDEYIAEKPSRFYGAMNHLSFLIRINDRNPKAQEIWQSDLNYIQSKDMRYELPSFLKR